eukprot:13310649-Alexandrium_andersonii.AAC.1
MRPGSLRSIASVGWGRHGIEFASCKAEAARFEKEAKHVTDAFVAAKREGPGRSASPTRRRGSHS